MAGCAAVKKISKTSKVGIKHTPMTTEKLTNDVLKALEEIRPFLNSDGGDISLVSIEDGKHVTVRLEGACMSCSVNQMTLRAGVETTIKKFAPQIETVVNIE